MGRACVGRLLGLQYDAHAAELSPDASLLALCSKHVAVVVDVPAGRPHTVLHGHGGRVNAASFVPRAPHLVVTVSDDRTFKVWDLDARLLLHQSAILAAPLTSLAIDHVTGESLGRGSSRTRMQSHAQTHKCTKAQMQMH